MEIEPRPVCNPTLMAGASPVPGFSPWSPPLTSDSRSISNSSLYRKLSVAKVFQQQSAAPLPLDKMEHFVADASFH